MKRGILAFFGILGLWVYVSAGSEGMVRGSRAVGVSWDMGMAQGLRVGVWEGSEMVYCTTAASHLKGVRGWVPYVRRGCTSKTLLETVDV